MISRIDALANPKFWSAKHSMHGIRYRAHLTLPVRPDILQLRGFHRDGSGGANTVFGSYLEARPFLP